ncbi:hypothetical protein JCM10212_002613 [Sporobolomyces blumeae]
MRSTTLLCTLMTLVSVTWASSDPLASSSPDQIRFASPSTSSLPSLADLLTRSRHSRLFYDYARESRSVSTRLADPREATTVFAPVDQAIISLARKPHEGPVKGRAASTAVVAGSREDEIEKAEYLERWIERHLVPTKVDLDEPSWYRTIEGHTTLELVKGDEEGSFRVHPGNLEVVSHEIASNGVVLYIRGVLPLENVD